MKKIIATSKAPRAIGPYSQAVENGGLLFVSGQLPIDPQNGQIIKTDIQAQTLQALNNVKAILTEAGYTLDQVLKTTVYMTDMADFAAMNEVYKKFFVNNCPARSAVAIKALPLGASVEIEIIAGQ